MLQRDEKVNFPDPSAGSFGIGGVEEVDATLGEGGIGGVSEVSAEIEPLSSITPATTAITPTTKTAVRPDSIRLSIPFLAPICRLTSSSSF